MAGVLYTVTGFQNSQGDLRFRRNGVFRVFGTWAAPLKSEDLRVSAAALESQ